MMVDNGRQPSLAGFAWGEGMAQNLSARRLCKELGELLDVRSRCGRLVDLLALACVLFMDLEPGRRPEPGRWPPLLALTPTIYSTNSILRERSEREGVTVTCDWGGEGTHFCLPLFVLDNETF